jgi:Receptor family ligand binding region
VLRTQGQPTFVRLFPNDYHQAAAMAQLATELGCRALMVLHDDGVYGLTIAEGLRHAAVAAGMELAGYGHWHSSVAPFNGAAHPDGLTLRGVYSSDSAHALRERIRTLVAARVIAADGFLLPGVSPPC